MNRRSPKKTAVLMAGVLLLLFVLQFILPAYHHSTFSKIMVLASYAMGFNILLGYTGLMSLGHAMFFSTGMYATGISVYHFGYTGIPALGIGVLCTVLVSMLLGLVALRTSGVSFLIVTLMFGQAVFLSILYFDQFTLGQDGFTLTKELEPLVLGNASYSYTDPTFKYNAAWILFALSLVITNILILSPIGRVLIAIRENEERTQMLGYNTYLYKLFAMTLSGALSGLAGSVHALLFSYVGATFAEIHHSIAPLLWTLLGGVGTTLGPLLGTGIMHYLIDFTSGWTSAYLLIVGAILVLLVIGAPQGLMGLVRQKRFPWLP
ncbi:MAG TPA: branched-chain amino acid ABC transporter permease [SAR324 cluster bacterium]|jgi:branched-chain amino acid transport system permease protein|nr:branched-chain amino acid ABC transporter permease [SAR324 cluster bacterium]MEE1576279.1 branched-chain amino acid ABC transporter permease [Deltaproteobacteria bacterium]MDP6329648.1 branched-chain amino acid ABC transporter permease [SAR324 cluster bacterium]MDP7500879.1 branched-chain amino acid ABC transporter permease [SAR324 cluster bacterium]HJL88460.1 branched-chain amino acid ABC transporter permease [SAR324 cluster bacterium]|tara:strand:- start:6107 stop:7069 length:963 start_codon:yes stop_codon:yes gene_type:complete